jgi:CHAD domain-containing protein
LSNEIVTGMLKKKKLKKFIRKNIRKTRWLLKTLKGVVLEKEVLHDLRVQNKKLKSLTQLLKSIYNKKNYSTKAASPLFKLAGKIRTAQLILQQLEHYHIQNEKIDQEQNACIRQASCKLVQQRKEFKKIMARMEERLLKKCISVKDKSVLQYYNQGINALRLSLVVPQNADQLHECRKEIKNLLYALALMPSSLQSRLNINEKYLDELQNLIGQWHDDCILLELLTKEGYVNETGCLQLYNDKEELLQQIKMETAHFDKEVRLAPQPESSNTIIERT